MVDTTYASRSQSHLPVLDGVRGVAILLVLVLHLGVLIPKTPSEKFALEVISAGWIGVDLFFVLSGALITGILLDTAGSPNYFRNFYIRRALRIFPLYYLILIVSFYVLPLFPHPKVANFSRVSGDEWWYWLFLSNFRIAAAGGPQHGIMDVTWSLAIEEHYYLFWPLAVRFLTRKQLAISCIGLILCALLARAVLQAQDTAPFAIYVLTFTRIDGLAAGALVALLIRRQGMTKNDLRRLALSGIGTLAAGLAVVSFADGGLLPWDGRHTQLAGYTLIALFFACGVLLAYVEHDRMSWYARILRSRYLVFMGTLSYALYLTHLPLRAVVRDTLLRPNSFQDWWGDALVGQLAFYLVAGTLVIAAAWVIHHFYERRFLILKSVLTNRPSTLAGHGKHCS